MKKIGFIVQFLCLALFSFGQSAGDGIRFIEGEKWENVLKMAQEQDKYIFMDCYTSWCGPCKLKIFLLVKTWATFLMRISST